MKKRIILGAITYSLLCAQGLAAVTYDLTPTVDWVREKGRWQRQWVPVFSPCPTNGYYSNGLSVYVCPSNVNLYYGDNIVTGGSTSQLVLRRYTSLGGGNTIGSPSHNLSLDLNRNSFSAHNLYVYGHVDNGSYIQLTNSTILGSLRSVNNGLELNNVDIRQNALAYSQITINSSNVDGYVDSDNGGISLYNVKVGSDVEAKSQIQMTNTSVGGHISSSHGGVELSASGSTKLVDGYINAKNAVKVTNYKVNQSVSADGYIELNRTDVTGNVTSQSNGNPAIAISNSSSISGDVFTKGYVSVSHSIVDGNIDNTQGSNQSMSIVSSQVGGNVTAKGYVDIQYSQVSGVVSSTDEGGQVKSSKINGDVDVKKYLHVIESSYVCGVASSWNDGANISNSYVGDDVSTKKYLHVTNSSVFGTASVKNEGMALSSAKILADAKAIGFPTHKDVSIASNSTLCGTANSSYSYNGKLVGYCGLNDTSCDTSQTRGTCPVEVGESSQYKDFYDYCGMTPPGPDPEPIQCESLPPEDFDSGSLTNWSVMGFKNSAKPSITGGKFRLSSNQYNQATASAYNYIFPSDDNVMQVEFNHYAHSNTTRPGADGVGIVFSDANVPPATGAFGGPLGFGVKPGLEGFAGGWLAFGIDEYGNFSNEGSYYENDYGRPGRSQQSIAIRGAGYKKTIQYNGQSKEGWFGGYKFIKNNTDVGALDVFGTYYNGRGEDEVHRYRMTVDSRKTVKNRASGVWVSIERQIDGGRWETLIKSFNVMNGYGQSIAPENFRISVTASTGSYTNIHEIDDFQVCADKYKKLTDGIHHFEFDYSGSGSTCQPSKVTLKACMNERCTQTYPEDAAAGEGELEPLTVTLLPSSTNSVANWVNGEQEKLTDITFNNSVDLLLQGYKAGTVTMGVANSSVPQFGFEGARCRINNGDELSVENCNVLFSQNVLGVNIGDVVSARQSAGTDHLSFCSSHVKAGGESRDVTMKVTHEIAPVDKTKSVEVWYKKAGDSNAKWSGHTVLQPQVAKSLSDVYFDSNGKAYLKVNYKEVGKIRIDAKVNDVKDSAGFASFVSFPAKLSLNVSGNGACLPDCKSYIPAGQEFTMQVTAYQSDGEVARNYQESHISIDHVVTYPDPTTSVNKGNVVNGSLLTEKLPEDAKWVSGSVSFKQSVDEVGSFEFTATAPVGGEGEAFSTYLGSSTYKIADATLNVGRFYPSKFNVYSSDQTTSYNNIWDYPNGQAFAYMGQPFGLKQFYVEALSKGDGALHNYAYFDARHQAKFNLYEDNYANVNRFSAPGTYTGNWLNGSRGPYVSGQSVGKYSASGLVWNKVVTKPDGPLNYLENSSDTSISIDLSSSSVDKVGVTIGTKELFVQPDLRFGRVNLADVGGKQGDNNKPDSLKLQVPLTVEYWKDGRFVTNISDSQTTIYGVREKFEHKWKGNEPDSKYVDVSLNGGGVVTKGTSRSIVAVESESNRQQTELWLDLTAGSNHLPWLKYNWDNKNAGEENPSSVVTFGIHRGNDRVIYRGEPGLTGQ
ncbi:TPA: hypothetical protein NKZ82_004031 [Vibrio parahaemolyticus]|uniref:DUF6701 domain-containing protein n=2 Tax=Vibrio parahaemolyticus TaxID=670 RepID=UPI00111F1C1A|nr:DUF6701 domain-containing protein [Vibrio parahaemolyticus]TOQ49575.1 hypothetical protein CGG94_20540 [Vibrio parahaemolyticus]HCG7543952.1 hypothetical protein [Vibrio parahaemolyticus]HCH0358156.1 hypothetical protein [Vibrio parahaemolyticus]HCH5750002.1 hypothetical protein [Vibrio parahaemolyticus]